MKKPLPGDKTVMKHCVDLLADIKTRIRQAQSRAVMSANAEMIRLYWDVGQMVASAMDWKVEARAYCDGWRSTLKTLYLKSRVFPSEISNS
jgi:hypothetical protein